MTETALALRGRPSLARRHGWSITTLVVGLGVAVAIASTFTAVLAVGLYVGLFYAERPTAAARRELRGRRRQRARRLQLANVATDELVELTNVVDAAVVADPNLDAADMETLLDRYVDLAIARDRCAELVRREQIAELSRRLDHATRTQQPRRKRAIARRITWWHRCEARLRRLDEQLADVAGLIRLYGERATMPELAFLLDADPVTTALDQVESCESR